MGRILKHRNPLKNIAVVDVKIDIAQLEKKKLKNEEIDETVEDEIWQRTCPKCGKSHDIDYPKCPNCKYNYLE